MTSLLANLLRDDLDDLYRKALDIAVQRDAGGSRESFERVKARLGRLLFVKEALPLPSLVALRCKDDPLSGDTKGFHYLAALLIGVSSDTEPVRPLHASLREYLLSQKASDDLFIDEVACQKRLASSTLRVMEEELQFNMGQLKTSYVANMDQSDSKTISPHLAYASRYWAHHVKEGNALTENEDKLKTLFDKNFLFWLEALSLTVSLGTAISSLAVIISEVSDDHGVS